VARACLAALGSQLRALKAEILEFDRRIIAWHRSATSKRLYAIPGVGPALATALVASIADPKAFRSPINAARAAGVVWVAVKSSYTRFRLSRCWPANLAGLINRLLGFACRTERLLGFGYSVSKVLQFGNL
jgi:transposase